jgi:hypothetical protein
MKSIKTRTNKRRKKDKRYLFQLFIPFVVLKKFSSKFSLPPKLEIIRIIINGKKGKRSIFRKLISERR